MKLEGLTKGERWVIEWQYRMHGDFNTALSQAIMMADRRNLAKLAQGFPDEVSAFRHYSEVDGWWEALQKKAECRPGT